MSLRWHHAPLYGVVPRDAVAEGRPKAAAGLAPDHALFVAATSAKASFGLAPALSSGRKRSAACVRRVNGLYRPEQRRRLSSASLMANKGRPQLQKAIDALGTGARPPNGTVPAGDWPVPAAWIGSEHGPERGQGEDYGRARTGGGGHGLGPGGACQIRPFGRQRHHGGDQGPRLRPSGSLPPLSPRQPRSRLEGGCRQVRVRDQALCRRHGLGIGSGQDGATQRAWLGQARAWTFRDGAGCKRYVRECGDAVAAQRRLSYTRSTPDERAWRN